nr:MAG TPA: hypothetical protein [Caudoviricetes sp.]
MLLLYHVCRTMSMPFFKLFPLPAACLASFV